MYQPDPGSVPTLALKDITKSMGSVRTLQGVSLSLLPHEVHALAGENGPENRLSSRSSPGCAVPIPEWSCSTARRTSSTGRPTRGTLASRSSTRTTHLFPELSATKNILIGRQLLGALCRIDHHAVHERAAALMGRLGVALDPERLVCGLPIAAQQVVETAKALSPSTLAS